jgi:hypothetical protein
MKFKPDGPLAHQSPDLVAEVIADTVNTGVAGG